MKTFLRRLSIKEVGKPALGIREFRLANGLRVLLHQDHIAPVVTHAIAFRVGSVNEGAGETGSTHFLEHMMFMGTNKYGPDKGNGFDQLLVPIGAVNNAMTSRDWTIYHEVGASEHLELFIRLNADRVRGLKLRQHDHDSEMTVVRNEMEQGDNDPEEALTQALYATAFRQFPYHHDTIGYRSDVEGMPISVLEGHYARHYWANNATVTLSGDFEVETALRLINKYYGKVPASPKPIPTVYTVEPPQAGVRRFEVRMPGSNNMVAMAFHAPAPDHADYFPLAVFDHILGNSGDRTSPLYKRFVATRLCSNIFSTLAQSKYPELFRFYATLTQSASPEVVEAAIMEELARFGNEPVSQADLERVRMSQSKELRLALSNSNTFALKISQVDSQSGWRWLAQYTDKFNAVTAEDIIRVCKKYFTPTNCSVGYFFVEDGEESNSQENPDKETAAIVGDTAAEVVRKTKERLLRLAPKPTLKMKTAGRVQYGKEASTTVLPNGLTLVVLPHAGSGVVGVNVTVKAGSLYRKADEVGVSGMVSGLLSAGSARYSKTQVAQAYLQMGILTSAGWGESRQFASLGTSLAAEDLPRFLDIIADQLRQPLFEEDELSTAKMKRLAKIEQVEDDPAGVVQQSLFDALYADGHALHPVSFDASKAGIEAATTAQLRAFHSRCYVPSATVISLVGDVTVDQAVAIVTAGFGDWTGGPCQPLPVEAAPLSAGKTVKSPMKGKSTIEIMMAHPLDLVVTDTDFAALKLANAALGDDTMMSRLGAYLRVQKGYTYGAVTKFADDQYRGAPWYLKLSVNPKVLDAALNAANAIIRDTVENGITEQEYAMAQGMTTGLFHLSMGTLSQIAALLSRYTLLGLGFDKIDTVVEQYKSVTREQVNAALRNYIHPDKLITSLAGTFEK